MQEGFPFKKKIVNRYYPINYGGDGRYLWDIARVDKTVTVIDLASNTTVATIPVASINDWVIGNYVPADKCLYVHYNAGHYKIDLDPSSGTFCTVLANNSNFPQSNSGNSISYWQPLDAFIGVSNELTMIPRLSPSSSSLLFTGPKNVIVGAAQNLGWMAQGGVNPTQLTGWINLNTGKRIGIGSSNSFVAPVINRRFLIEFSEYDENNIYIRTVNTSGYQAPYVLEFCPRSKRLIGGGGNGSGWRLSVIDHKLFTLVGNTPYVSTPGAPAAWGYQYRNVVFSPYTGMVYARSYYHAGNVTDIHIYDCTLALASMYQGYLVSGNDRVPAVTSYQNGTMGLNRLKNDEHYY